MDPSPPASREPAAAETPEPAKPWTADDWAEMGRLFQKMSEFFIKYCNTYNDDHESVIRIRDKPDCPPRLRNTVYGKEIWWMWKAQDLYQPPDRNEEDEEGQPTVDSLCLPRRDHHTMLHMFFWPYNLLVKKHDTHWIVCLSSVEGRRIGTHVFVDCRSAQRADLAEAADAEKEEEATTEEEEETEETDEDEMDS